MRHLQLAFALMAAVLWAVSYVVSVAQQDYTGFSVSTPVVLLVGGWLLRIGLRNGKGGRNGDESDE